MSPLSESDCAVSIGVLRARMDALEARLDATVTDFRGYREEDRHFHEMIRAAVDALSVRLADYALDNEKARTATLSAALVAAVGGAASLVAVVLGHVL